MKKLTRYSLATAALATLLGITACAGEAPATQPKVDASPAADASASPVSTVKADGFDEKIVVNDILPADWELSSGWRAITKTTEDNVFAVGDHLAYLEGRELQPDGDIQVDGRLVFVDGKGNKTYPASDDSVGTYQSSDLNSVTRDGKNYLVYSEKFTVQGDSTSMSKSSGDKTVAVITVFDDKGKKLYSKQHDAATSGSRDTVKVGDSHVLNVTTGDVISKPEHAGHEWLGTYDGVNIFTTREYTGTRTLTDGHWEITVPIPFENYTVIYSFGNDIAVKTLEGCQVIDPHSGENVDPALNQEGLCESNQGANPVASPNGDLVAFGQGVYSLKDKKMLITFGNDIEFNPVSISNNGDTYGTGIDKKVGFVNVLKGGDPVGLPGATVVPMVVSDSGLAAFHDYKDKNSTLFMTKR